MMKSALSLFTHTFAHFCVDFGCFFLLYGGLAKTVPDLASATLGFLLYNVIAFGLQPIIGAWCDRHPQAPVAVIGCLLLAAGLLFLRAPWPALAVCALGNACFHIGGGIESLINAQGKMYRSGVFVSSGALGVVLGMLAGKNSSLPLSLPILLTVLSAVFLAIVNPAPSRRIATAAIKPQTANPGLPFGAVLLLCAGSIIVRAYVGSIVPISWRTTTWLMILPALGAGCGKACGGFLADRFGARTIGAGSLLLSLPLLVWGNTSPMLCLTGLLLFNISMSITLVALYALLPRNPGLAFGITTLALLIGSLPGFFLQIPGIAVPLMISILIILSTLSLFLAVTNQRGGIEHVAKK